MPKESFVRGVHAIAATVVLGSGVSGGVKADEARLNFQVPEGVFESVTTAQELVDTLRTAVTFNVTAPMAGTLKMLPGGYAGDPTGRQPPFIFGFASLGVALDAGQSVQGTTYGDAVRSSLDGNGQGPWGRIELMSDWDEDASWAKLTDAIDTGLMQSGLGFSQPSGRAGFTVDEVEVLEFTYAEGEDSAAAFFECCMDRATGPVIEFRAVPQIDGDTSGVAITTEVIVFRVSPSGGDEGTGSPEDRAAETNATMLINGACPRMAPVGTSVIALGGRERAGVASASRGPDGQLLLTLGGFEGGAPTHCLVLYTPWPAAEGTFGIAAIGDVFPVSAPDGNGDYAAAFAPRLSGGPVVVGVSGSVKINSIGDTVDGALEVSGWTTGRDGARMEIDFGGAFSAIIQ